MTPGLAEALKAEALAMGFADIGICRPDAMKADTVPALATYVAEGRHGDMGWMAERMPWRGDPTALWPEARSIIMLAENYGPNENPLDLLDLRRPGGDFGLCAQSRLS